MFPNQSMKRGRKSTFAVPHHPISKARLRTIVPCSLPAPRSRPFHRFLQLAAQERDLVALKLNASTLKGKVAELESLLAEAEREITSIRDDKKTLIDHVADLQRQVHLIGSQ